MIVQPACVTIIVIHELLHTVLLKPEFGTITEYIQFHHALPLGAVLLKEQ
jgi:hypothetical protein